MRSPDAPAWPRGAVNLHLAGESKVNEAMRRIQLTGTTETATHEILLAVADVAAINGILAHLQSQTGHDLNHYKRSTLLRRITRRRQMNSLASLDEYLDYLRQHPEETQALFTDCLISVTQFFRDPEVFDRLETEVIPKLLAGKNATERVRVWVAGCATGEEAYSVAILLVERLDELAALGLETPHLQLFATDIDEEAIAFARRGLYSSPHLKQITPARLQRFFSEESEGYRVKLALRETVLFAVHNLLKDPPFSKLDLITCRNVLIYFNREAQEKTFDIFHYALNPAGYLFLGTAESADMVATLFSNTDKRHHFFQRQAILATTQRLPTTAFVEGNPKLSGQTARPTKPKNQSIEELYQQWTLRHYAPPRVLVNENYEVTHIFNGADRYLREREGAVTQNILLKVLPELRLDLRAALYQAFNQGERTDSRLLRVEIENESCLIQLHVGPVPEPNFPKDYMEVVFEERQETAVVGLPEPKSAADTDNTLTSRLEDELLRTRERLQTIIEEHEGSNQDLKVTNEELQSINEELKSTTEELETSKEELQSMNEELAAVNHELKLKIEELSHVNSDLSNLIASTDVGAVFLDQSLRVKRFTPRATELFYLINTDISRPFAHIAHRIRPGATLLIEARLVELAARVLSTLEQIEDVVQSDDERWYIMRMFPYRTVTNLVDGVVITFVDITEIKRAEHEIKQRIQQQTVAELGRLALQGSDLAALMTTATQRVAEVLQVEFAKVLEAQADSKTLLFKTGVGWLPEIVQEVALLTPENTQSWYTFHQDKPVVVENIQQEKRFQPSPMLSAHRVISGVTVVIPSPNGLYGVLGIYSQKPRAFTRYEVDFLQAVANLLAEALARQAVEDDLRASEARFRQLADAMPQIVWVSDPGGHLTYVNQGWLDYSGLSINENLLNGLWAAVHPDDRPGNQARWEQAVQTGIAYEDELRLRNHAGVYRWYLERGVPIRDVNGVVLEWYTTATDIHERKRVELNQQFLTALDAQLRPVTDPDLIRQLAVEALGAYLQVDRCTLNEVDADTTRLIVPAHYRQANVASIEGVHYLSDLVDAATLDESRAGRTVSFTDTQTDLRSAAKYATGYQLRNIRALIAVPCLQAGHWVALLSVHSATPRTWQAEEIALIEAVAARIWPAIVKARAEQALRQKEEQLRLITDNVQGLIAYIDREERYQFVNAAYESWYERPRAQILGHKFSEFIRPQTYLQAQPYIAAALAGQAVTFELETSRAAKRVSWLMRYTPHLATDGQVLGFYTLITDITERKQTEDQLRYHAHLLENIEDAVIATDVQLHVTAWNRGAEKIYGWPAHEVLGRPLSAVINSTLTQEQRQELLHDVNQSGYYNFEVMYHQNKNGDLLQLEATTIALRGTDNQVTGYLSINRDIRARKQAEQQIKFQASLLDVVEQAVIAIDLTGHIIYWNRFAEQLYGWRSTEVAGRSAAAIIPNTTTPEQTAAMATQFRNGKSWSGEFMVQHQDGTFFPAQVLNSPIYGENGALLGFVGVSVDITERKEAETALRQQANMLENTYDAIFMWELGGKVVYWNRGAERLYGYSKAEALEQSSHTLLQTMHPRDIQVFEATLHREREWTGELQHITKDGRRLTVLSRHQLLHEADGRIYVLETSHDITERKDYERQLQEFNERLEQRVSERTAELAQRTQELMVRNRELDQFAYVASHDLRSPLRAIDHLANWISQDATDLLPAASKEHLYKLRGRVKRLEKLLDDLLAYSRADRYQYPIEQVDTGALVNDIVRLLAPPEDFTITIQADMPVLTTVRVPLELVLRNLINNAIKHHHRSNGHIQVAAHDQGDFIEFVITDDGPGIAAEFHERIFQMFQTLQPRDKIEGSGIGLTIVKKVVENRGGVVRLNSDANAGASFSFTWPK